jgi:YHS domain-containing protein
MRVLPMFLLVAAVIFSVLISSAAREGQRHRSHQDGTARPRLAADPVCGMPVAPDEGYAKRHAGHTYHFRSKSCLDRFEANPDEYRIAS